MVGHVLFQRGQFGIEPLRLLDDFGFIGAELDNFRFK
jgi:hypothetical protein